MCALALPSFLALVPHAAAPLAGVAGLCAVGVLAARPPEPLSSLHAPAALFGMLLLWGALSAFWAIDPRRSLVLDLRLLGLFAAALALAAASGRLAAPRRLTALLLVGTAIGAAIALVDLATTGGLSGYFSIRVFRAARLNQVSAWLAIMALPFAAALAGRGRRLLGLVAAAGMAATVAMLDGSTAKIALILSLPAAAALYRRRVAIARLAGVLAVLAILTAPLTLPQIARQPAWFAAADRLKESAGHRVLIWSFAGDRIAERPYLGWGLDSARAIPGGSDEIRPAQNWLPLHPHDAALQVWLELGAPAAAMFALLIGLLWWRLAEVRWSRLYAAAAGGSLAAALFVALAGWGIWQEWWLGTLGFAAFATLVMARAADDAAR